MKKVLSLITCVLLLLQTAAIACASTYFTDEYVDIVKEYIDLTGTNIYTGTTVSEIADGDLESKVSTGVASNFGIELTGKTPDTNRAWPIAYAMVKIRSKGTGTDGTFRLTLSTADAPGSQNNAELLPTRGEKITVEIPVTAGSELVRVDIPEEYQNTPFRYCKITSAAEMDPLEIYELQLYVKKSNANAMNIAYQMDTSQITVQNSSNSILSDYFVHDGSDHIIRAFDNSTADAAEGNYPAQIKIKIDLLDSIALNQIEICGDNLYGETQWEIYGSNDSSTDGVILSEWKETLQSNDYQTASLSGTPYRYITIASTANVISSLREIRIFAKEKSPAQEQLSYSDGNIKITKTYGLVNSYDFSALFDGDLYDKQFQTDADEWLSIQIDLKQPKSIHSVSVWGGTYGTKCQIYGSNTQFIDPAAADSTAPTLENGMLIAETASELGDGQNFIAEAQGAQYQYVLIYAPNGTGGIARSIKEIKVFTSERALEDEESPKDTFKPGESATVVFGDLEGQTSGAQTASLIAAVYDAEKNLSQIILLDSAVDITGGSELRKTITIPSDVASGSKVRVFLWTSSLQPLPGSGVSAQIS